MYLAKIRLDLRERGIRIAVADCQQLHRLVAGLYGVSRSEGQLLYRLRTGGAEALLYLYSAVPMQPSRLLPGMILEGERDVSAWVKSMDVGRCISFDLLAMPAKKSPSAGHRLSQRRVFRTQEERIAWLERKAAQNGFTVLSVQELGSRKVIGRHAKDAGGVLTLDAYHYQGLLQIDDASAFQAALCNGIGAGKAYGLGMLLLR